MPERLTPDEYEELDFQISEVEEMRSMAHHMNIRGWDEFGLPGATLAQAQEMADVVRNGELALDLFLDNPVARTATLGIMRLRGDWARSDWMQQTIIHPENRLHQAYEAKVFTRDDPENKLSFDIDWGMVSMKGLTMVTSRRLLLRTQPFEQEFTHSSGNHVLGKVVIDIDELSTFALDIERLHEISEAAAQEVRLVIIAGMVMSRDHNRLRRAVSLAKDNSHYDAAVPDGASEERAEIEAIVLARQKMEQYGISADRVLERIATARPAHVRSPESIATIEAAIQKRSDLLIPVTTTFYAERQLKSFRV